MNRSIESLALFSLLLAGSSLAWSQEIGDDEPRRCLTLIRVDYTEVIDDRHIAFHMRGSDIYVNELERRCPGLRQNTPFSYRTSTGQLCRVDSITVLENLGFGMREGATCGLGMFVPIDEDALAMLKGEEAEAEIEVEDIEVDESE
jgi:hypothetical protein